MMCVVLYAYHFITVILNLGSEGARCSRNLQAPTRIRYNHVHLWIFMSLSPEDQVGV
jgi:hypothetical protein